MTEAILILALIVLNGILSMAEAAMLSSRKSKLAAQSESGDLKARNALKLLQQQDIFLSTVQIGVTLVGILSGIFSGASITRSLTALLLRTGMGASTASAISHIVVVLICLANNTQKSITFHLSYSQRTGTNTAKGQDISETNRWLNMHLKRMVCLLLFLLVKLGVRR